jgi:four helix bundle protein
MGDYRKLFVFQKAFDLAMEIFELTKSFPPEEKFSLTGQVRKSSRSVCTNFVEAYKRRRYKDYFISKLNDSETENAETQVWLEFSLACKYISPEKHIDLTAKNDEVARLVLYMIINPDKFR